MKQKITIRLILIAMLAVLMTTPSLAQNSQHNDDLKVIKAHSSSAASASWFIDTVDSNSPFYVGQHVSIALHPVNGRPYISYYDASYTMLRMAKYVVTGGNCGPDNAWSCETVDKYDVGEYNSIVVDPVDNFPIISYYDTSNGGRLKVAERKIFAWDIKTIYDPDIGSAGRYSSLKIGSTDKIRIAYYVHNFLPGNNDSLWYAEYVGGGGNCGGSDYQCDPVNSGDRVGKYASLALDSFDQPHIAYYDEGNDSLKYAHYNGSWLYRWILNPNAGKHASLVVDVNNGDRPHIAHYDSTHGTLEYATFVGAGNGNCGMNNYSQWEWQCDDIDDMGIISDPRGISIAVDGSGYPIIAYQSGGSRLMVARPAAALGKLIGNCGPATPFYTWQCDPITRIGIGFGQGDYMSLAVNSAGLSTIAYYGTVTGSGGDLKVAYQRLEVFVPLTLRNSN